MYVFNNKYLGTWKIMGLDPKRKGMPCVVVVDIGRDTTWIIRGLDPNKYLTPVVVVVDKIWITKFRPDQVDT